MASVRVCRGDFLLQEKGIRNGTARKEEGKEVGSIRLLPVNMSEEEVSLAIVQKFVELRADVSTK